MKEPSRFKDIDKNRRRAVLLLGVGIFLMLCGGTAGFFLSNTTLFDLKEVEFKGLERLDPLSLQDWGGIVMGEHSLKIPRKEIGERLKTNPLVKDAAVRYVFPAKLLVIVQERQPLAQVRIEERFLTVSEDGVCLERDLARNQRLPLITGVDAGQADNPGDMIESEGLIAALNLIDCLDPYFLESIQEFRAFSAWELTLVTHQGVEVKFGPPENLERKMGYYETILLKNHFQYNEDTVEYLDLRYETEPVIKKKTVLKKG